MNEKKANHLIERRTGAFLEEVLEVGANDSTESSSSSDISDSSLETTLAFWLSFFYFILCSSALDKLLLF